MPNLERKCTIQAGGSIIKVYDVPCGTIVFLDGDNIAIRLHEFYDQVKENIHMRYAFFDLSSNQIRQVDSYAEVREFIGSVILEQQFKSDLD